jgi:hypothetical protein
MKNREEELNSLYVELEAVEEAFQRSFGREEAKQLNKRRGEILGKIKKLERL